MAKIENTVPGLAGWETVRLIGRGSFGGVYEIRRDVFGDTERCALKHLSVPRDESEIQELRIEGQDGESITRTFTNQARSIVSEYKLMMQLNNCPNVVTCHDVETVQKDDGYGWDIYIRMELLTPLMKQLEGQQELPETEILRLGREIGNALVACRRQKILHRDIKPQNIMVAGDGTYKLGDFGIARMSEKTGSATSRIGTYTYMAPEVYNGEHYGALADLYSLGMVLYWLLNGRRAPFVTVNTAEEKETALRRRMRGEALPAPLNGSPELKRIVQKCCAYDPKERFQSPEELLRALEAVNNSEFGIRNSELRQEQTPAPVGAAASRPSATSNAVSSDNPVGAIHESPADPGERRSAPVGVGAPDDPQTETDGNGLSRTPAPTAKDETVDVFRSSNEETPDGTLGAGLAPARGRGQTTEPPGGASPSPTTVKEEKTVADLERRKAAPEGEAAKEKKSKKKIIISIGIALAAVLALILLLIPKGGQTTNEPAETATPTEEPAPEPTLEPTPEPIDEPGLAYENALALLEAGQYEEAIAAFEALGDYEDSAERLLQAQYGHADALAAEGKTYEAALAFSEIRDYRDAWDRCFALWGQITQRDTLSTGDDHTVGLRSDGTAVATKYIDDGVFGYCGQCEVDDWTNVVAVSAEYFFTVGLRSDGTVLSIGDNSDGQCEVDDWTNIVAVSTSYTRTVGLRSDGTVIAVGNNFFGACEVDDWTDIVAVSTGIYHTVGLRSDGTVTAVGDEGDDRCLVGGWRNIVAISAGDDHTVGLRSDGTVVATGNNDHGQCNVSDWTDIVAIAAGGEHTVGLRSDGTVVAAGDLREGWCKVDGWTDIVAVSAGNWFTVGLRSDGTVVVVGDPERPQWDVSDWTDIALPEKRARN